MNLSREKMQPLLDLTITRPNLVNNNTWEYKEKIMRDIFDRETTIIFQWRLQVITAFSIISLMICVIYLNRTKT